MRDDLQKRRKKPAPSKNKTETPVMQSIFQWRGQPSTVGPKLMVGLHKPKDPTPITFSKRVHSSSIASAQKLKQRPGVGWSATA